MRSWLNDNFLNYAFTAEHINLIPTVEVDNSQASTGYGSHQYIPQDNTNDKVYLPSYADLTNPNYGFYPNNEYDDSARRINAASDYAVIKNIMMAIG